jgi:hypothetical protein
MEKSLFCDLNYIILFNNIHNIILFKKIKWW